nr:gamma-secretase subunit PEN-2 [Pelodiscus sinensis]|eukprot:XP_006118324.1 gamma-secretase subunit PEN-2 [Pelodiscus sinensis]
MTRTLMGPSYVHGGLAHQRLVARLGGFALLPFLWLVNVLWFCREAFLAPAYTEQPQIKSYVQRSAVGLLFWVVVLTTWVTIFQTHRARWGELGDYLSFTIPLGIP